MNLFRKKPLEEKVKKALDSYREEAVSLLFPGGVPEAEKIVSDLAALCGLKPEHCGTGKCEELLDLYAEVANATDEGSNREKKVNLLRNKYGATVTDPAMADRICNYCESRQGTGSAFGEDAEETEFPEEEESDTEEEPDFILPRTLTETDAGEDPEEEPEEEDFSPKALVRVLTESFDLDGKERKKALEILKPERKRYLREALEKFPEDPDAAVKTVFAAGCMAAGGRSRGTEAETELPGRILSGSRAAERWPEMEEEEKKDLLKLAWEMGVRAGTVPEPEDREGEE